MKPRGTHKFLLVTARVRKVLLVRLLLAWLLLSTLIGTVAYLIEIRRVDDFVKDLAINESSPFAQENGEYLNSEEPAHRRLLLEHMAND